MKLWELTCLLALLGSLGYTGAAQCPDMSAAKPNLTFTERLEKASIVVFGTSTMDINNVTTFNVECVLKTDGFSIQDNITIDYPACDGFGDLPAGIVNINYIALIRRTYRGYTWEFFGHNQRAHGANPMADPDFHIACGLSSCSSLVFDSKPCRISQSDVSPLVHSVRTIFEAKDEDRPGIMIRYESSPWTFTACCRNKHYSGGVLDLGVDEKGRHFDPYRLRKVPKVHLDPNSGKSASDRYHTVLMAEVSGKKGNAGSRIKPYINWLQVNLKTGSALSARNTILSYEKPLPRQLDTVNHYVFLVFEQSGKLDYPVSLRPYASNALGCSKDYRCSFDVSLFQKEANLTLVYASDVTCRQDVYSRLQNGEDNLPICKDLWPKAKVMGTNMICPTTAPETDADDSATTARSQVLGLAVFISILLIFKLF